MGRRTSHLIRKTIIEGHAIAHKISNCKTEEEIDSLDVEIAQYANFVDTNFGIEGDIPNERVCELSFMLIMAAEEKARQLKYYPEQSIKGNSDVEHFEKLLDSRTWENNVK